MLQEAGDVIKRDHLLIVNLNLDYILMGKYRKGAQLEVLQKALIRSDYNLAFFVGLSPSSPLPSVLGVRVESRLGGCID